MGKPYKTTKICPVCLQDFDCFSTAKYCRKCVSKIMIDKMKKKLCEVCGKEFKGTKRISMCCSCRYLKRVDNARNWYKANKKI